MKLKKQIALFTALTMAVSMMCSCSEEDSSSKSKSKKASSSSSVSETDSSSQNSTDDTTTAASSTDEADSQPTDDSSESEPVVEQQTMKQYLESSYWVLDDESVKKLKDAGHEYAIFMLAPCGMSFNMEYNDAFGWCDAEWQPSRFYCTFDEDEIYSNSNEYSISLELQHDSGSDTMEITLTDDKMTINPFTYKCDFYSTDTYDKTFTVDFPLSLIRIDKEKLVKTSEWDFNKYDETQKKEEIAKNFEKLVGRYEYDPLRSADIGLSWDVEKILGIDPAKGAYFEIAADGTISTNIPNLCDKAQYTEEGILSLYANSEWFHSGISENDAYLFLRGYGLTMFRKVS